MKCTVSRAELLKVLSVAEKALPKGAVIPLIENLHLEFTGSQLVAKATDTKIEVVSKMDFDTEKTLSVLLPPNFIPVLSALDTPDVGLEFNLDGDAGTVKLSGGKSVFTLYVRDVGEYPVIEERSPEGRSLSFTEKELKEQLKEAILCVSTDESQPTFNCVVFRCTNKNVQVVSSDTYRLSRRINQKVLGETQDFLVPASSLKELIRLLGDADDAVDVFPADGRLVFKAKKFYFAAFLASAKYPDLSIVIPQQHTTQIVLKTKDFYDIVTRVSLIAAGANRAVCLRTTGESLEVYAKSNLGRVMDTAVLESKEGEDVRVYLNVGFLLDALKAVSSGEVRMCFNGSLGSVVVHDGFSNDWLCLILPIKMDDPREKEDEPAAEEEAGESAVDAEFGMKEEEEFDVPVAAVSE